MIHYCHTGALEQIARGHPSLVLHEYEIRTQWVHGRQHSKSRYGWSGRGPCPLRLLFDPGMEGLGGDPCRLCAEVDLRGSQPAIRQVRISPHQRVQYHMLRFLWENSALSLSKIDPTSPLQLKRGLELRFDSQAPASPVETKCHPHYMAEFSSNYQACDDFMEAR